MRRLSIILAACLLVLGTLSGIAAQTASCGALPADVAFEPSNCVSGGGSTTLTTKRFGTSLVSIFITGAVGRVGHADRTVRIGYDGVLRLKIDTTNFYGASIPPGQYQVIVKDPTGVVPPVVAPFTVAGNAKVAAPTSGRSSGATPTVSRSSGTQPTATRSSGTQPTATRSSGNRPTATRTSGTGRTVVPSPTPENCEESYPDFCIPAGLSSAEITCESPEVGGSHDFTVLPPDPYNLDSDGDGLGCNTTPDPTVTEDPNTFGDCEPSYPSICLPIGLLDEEVDCDTIVDQDFEVLPPDPYSLDLDGDGIGCESDGSDL